MNEPKAKEILSILSSVFGVCEPGFRFNRTSRGLYYPTEKIVTIPRTDRCGSVRSPEVRLLHEFAHHLADERGLKAGYGRCAHGYRFKNALWEVVTAYYGNARKYPWSTEYKMVRAYGERRLSE